MNRISGLILMVNAGILITDGALLGAQRHPGWAVAVAAIGGCAFVGGLVSAVARPES